jgi:hypothetical protein
MTKAKRFVLLALVLGGLLLAGSPALTPQATAWDVGPDTTCWWRLENGGPPEVWCYYCCNHPDCLPYNCCDLFCE